MAIPEADFDHALAAAKPKPLVNGFDKLRVSVVHHRTDSNAEFAFGLAEQVCSLSGCQIRQTSHRLLLPGGFPVILVQIATFWRPPREFLPPFDDGHLPPCRYLAALRHKERFPPPRLTGGCGLG